MSALDLPVRRRVYALSVSNPIASDRGLRIGELAARTGTTVKAIRYYESLCLLDPPHRAPNSYRLYAGTAVGHLQFIRRAKLLGLSLVEIKRLFETAKAGESGALRDQVTELLDEKLGDVERRIVEMEALRDSLRKRRRLAVISKAAPPCACHGFDVDCACLPVAPEEIAVVAAGSPGARGAAAAVGS